jgi:hypothetical protein
MSPSRGGEVANHASTRYHVYTPFRSFATKVPVMETASDATYVYSGNWVFVSTV